MNCPVCDDRMKEVERQGVALDICPSCKGVWLDRGELDKLLEMSRQEENGESIAPRSEAPRSEPPAYSQERRPEYTERRDDHHSERRDERHDERSGKPRRRSSLLGDILGAFGEGGD